MITTAVLGMVLQTMPIGDYDKRLVILTREKGKITAFAKGARKSNSAFLACSQPFVFGEFSLYEGRSSYNVMSTEITNYFEELRKDLEAAYYGFYFCELADYFTHENEEATETLKLLYQSLRALSQDSIGKELVRRIFELKLLVLNGIGPQVFGCIKCGKKEEIGHFIPEVGGVVCTECLESMKKSIRISEATLYTMQYITASAVEKLYNFTVTKEVLRELKTCLDNYKEIYIDKKIKSLELLEKLILT